MTVDDQQPLPAWLQRLWRRLAHLTEGRYFAIIEVKKRGSIHNLTLWEPAKVETLDKEAPDDAE